MTQEDEALLVGIIAGLLIGIGIGGYLFDSNVEEEGNLQAVYFNTAGCILKPGEVALDTLRDGTILAVSRYKKQVPMELDGHD